MQINKLPLNMQDLICVCIPIFEYYYGIQYAKKYKKVIAFSMHDNIQFEH